MKIKVSELIGPALDWAVAKCESLVAPPCDKSYWESMFYEWSKYSDCLDYSTNWEKAGLIIDREGIDLRQLKQSTHETMEMRHFDESKGDEVYRPPGWKRDMVRRPLPPHPMHAKWLARRSRGTDAIVNWSKTDFLSDTFLIAAMRCFVHGKLGDEIEVPDGLV